MSSSACSQNSTCSSGSNPLSTALIIGKVIGVVIACLIGLSMVICIVAVIYLGCFKKKPQIHVATGPYPSPYAFGHQVPIHPYAYYPQQPTAPLKVDSQIVKEDEAPPYETISKRENQKKSPINNSTQNSSESQNRNRFDASSYSTSERQAGSSMENTIISSSENRSRIKNSTENSTEDRAKSQAEIPTEDRAKSQAENPTEKD